jgi:hypothetical protein
MALFNNKQKTGRARAAVKRNMQAMSSGARVSAPAIGATGAGQAQTVIFPADTQYFQPGGEYCPPTPGCVETTPQITRSLEGTFPIVVVGGQVRYDTLPAPKIRWPSSQGWQGMMQTLANFDVNVGVFTDTNNQLAGVNDSHALVRLDIRPPAWQTSKSAKVPVACTWSFQPATTTAASVAINTVTNFELDIYVDAGGCQVWMMPLINISAATGTPSAGLQIRPAQLQQVTIAGQNSNLTVAGFTGSTTYAAGALNGFTTTFTEYGAQSLYASQFYNKIIGDANATNVIY